MLNESRWPFTPSRLQCLIVGHDDAFAREPKRLFCGVTCVAVRRQAGRSGRRRSGPASGASHGRDVSRPASHQDRSPRLLTLRAPPVRRPPPPRRLNAWNSSAIHNRLLAQERARDSLSRELNCGSRVRVDFETVQTDVREHRIAADSARVNRAIRWACLIARRCRRLFAARPLPGLTMPDVAPEAFRAAASSRQQARD